MAFKLICFCAFVAVARAGLPYAAPLAYAAAPAHVAYSAPAHVAYAAPVAKVAVAEPYNTNPQYSFSYDVQDGLTGDSKSAHESRNGDVVEGSYSLTDPDGTRRTVDYTADAHNGFNAVVRKEPLVQKTIVAAAPVAKVAYAAAPVHYAAPAQLAYSAPAHVAYSAPAHVAYSAPAQLAYSAPAYTKIAAPLAYAGHGYAAHGYAAPAAHYLH